MSAINYTQTNHVCALDLYNIIFLLEYSSVYSHSGIQRVFYNGCWRVEVSEDQWCLCAYGHLTQELLMAS